jgi:hypothetical protein
VTQGRTREGFSRLDAALAAISAGEVSPIAASIIFCSMLTACDRAGDVRRAEEWTGIVSGVLAGLGNKPRALHVHCRVAYGSVLYASGRWPEAEALMIEALGPAESASLSHRALTVAHLADLRIDQGRIAEAALLLAPFEDRLTSCGPLARVHLRRGQPALAEAVLRRGLREMVGDALRACSLLTLLVEVYLSRGAFDDARATADELAALAAGVDIGVVRAEAAVAAGRVLAATADRPAAIASFEDAKAHLAGDERPFQLGLVRIELGDRPAPVHLRQDRGAPRRPRAQQAWRTQPGGGGGPGGPARRHHRAIASPRDRHPQNRGPTCGYHPTTPDSVGATLAT